MLLPQSSSPPHHCHLAHVVSRITIFSTNALVVAAVRSREVCGLLTQLSKWYMTLAVTLFRYGCCCRLDPITIASLQHELFWHITVQNWWRIQVGVFAYSISAKYIERLSVNLQSYHVTYTDCLCLWSLIQCTQVACIILINTIVLIIIHMIAPCCSATDIDKTPLLSFVMDLLNNKLLTTSYTSNT